MSVIGRPLPPATPEGFTAAVAAIIAMDPSDVPVPAEHEGGGDVWSAERCLFDLALASRRRRPGKGLPGNLEDRLVALVAADAYWERIRSGEGWSDETGRGDGTDLFERLHRQARARVRGMLSSWS